MGQQWKPLDKKIFPRAIGSPALAYTDQAIGIISQWQHFVTRWLCMRLFYFCRKLVTDSFR
jgi:hypothetical protein